MRRLLSVLTVIALLLSSSVAFASVGYKKDGVPQGNGTYINVEGGYSSSDGSTVTLYTSGYTGDVTDLPTSCTDLTAANLAYGVFRYTKDASRQITLPAGTAGQMITIVCISAANVGDAGTTLVITDDYLSAANQAAVVETGWDDITFDAALDSVTLLYIDDVYGWIIVGQYGVSVT